MQKLENKTYIEKLRMRNVLLEKLLLEVILLDKQHLTFSLPSRLAGEIQEILGEERIERALLKKYERKIKN